MTFDNLNLKSAYYSDVDDILVDFYIPVLSEAVFYKRIAGYFSSNSFAIASKGISKLIENGGKIQLITNVVLSEDDQEIIKKSLEDIENNFIYEVKNLEESLKKDHISILGWLLKNNKIEIKIAVVKKGIEHQKIGILQDKNGNMVAFSGSDNETYQAWLFNDEQFHVYCSWLEGDKKHLDPDNERFDILWKNKSNNVKVYPITEAFKKGLIEIAPKDDEEFKRLSERAINELLEANKERQKEKKANIITLTDIQNKAVDNWIERGKIGIFEMATGTGKTFAALGCLKKVIEEENKLVCVISTPYGHLNRQWRKELIRFFGTKYTTIIADSGNYKWKKELLNSIYDMKNDVFDVLIIITTHDTLSSSDFISNIKKCDYKLFLIADEVHGLGAKKRRLGLIDKYHMRLGLSATPKRYFDEDGTNIILKFFGETLDGNPTFEFSLHDAINTVNPNDPQGRTYLAKYEYKPYFVELTAEELHEYMVKTKKIARAYYASKDEEKKSDYYQMLCIFRQKIIVNAENKFGSFSNILKEMKSVNDCLIFCSDKQIKKVMDILDKQNIRSHRFTMKEGVSPKKEYGGLSEREDILENFKKGVYHVLVAMKVLDEGVDIPSAKNAIFLASSENPKEFIQRRGRVLRQALNKEKAIIYDIIVIPRIAQNLPSESLSIESGIIKKEIKRIKEFAMSALNAIDCLEEIQKIERKYMVE